MRKNIFDKMRFSCRILVTATTLQSQLSIQSYLWLHYMSKENFYRLEAAMRFILFEQDRGKKKLPTVVRSE